MSMRLSITAFLQVALALRGDLYAFHFVGRRNRGN